MDILIVLLVALALVGYGLMLHRHRSRSEEKHGDIVTERRLRLSRLEGCSSLGKYSDAELADLELQLRNIAFKKSFRRRLSAEEQQLKLRFPTSFALHYDRAKRHYLSFPKN
jgi:hypothetical protein